MSENIKRCLDLANLITVRARRFQPHLSSAEIAKS